MKTKELFNLDYTLSAPLLSKYEYPWQALPFISEFIITLGNTLGENYDKIKENVWIEKSVKVSPSAEINGPCIIGAGSEIRHNAFIRSNALIGKNCVIGNSCEIKNAIIFDGAQVPHFNYIGDSILGHLAHFGAGAVTSNVKNDKSLVIVNSINTGLKKFGAMVGDEAEIGCNSVLNPGTVIGRGVSVYPLSSVRGVVAENHIYKSKDNIVEKY